MNKNKPLSGAEFALYRNNVDSGKLKLLMKEMELIELLQQMMELLLIH